MLKDEEEPAASSAHRALHHSRDEPLYEETSAYQMLREQNIAEINAAFRERFGHDRFEKKPRTPVNSGSGQASAPSKEPASTERKKVEPVRKSGRQRKVVNYSLDSFGGSEKSRRGKARKRINSDSDFDASDPDWSDEEENLIKSRKMKMSDRTADQGKKYSLREGTKKNYEEPAMYPEDFNMLCPVHKRFFEGGCEEHPLQFLVDTSQLVVKMSSVCKGRGLWNEGPTIPANTLMGPYQGEFLPWEEYEQQEASGTESGYAWIIKDPDMKENLGVIDPGHDPSPDNLLAFVNCGNSWSDIHCEAIQYRGSIFYMTTREIPQHVEILVYYGDNYAKMINIDPAELHKYSGAEDWSRDVYPCEICGLGFVSESSLFSHRENCRGKGFQKRNKPRTVCFSCKHCENKYASKQGFISHVKAFHNGVHSGIPEFKCTTCGKEFKRQADLKRHVREVHENNGIREFKCTTCGKEFKRQDNLKQHVRGVHEKIRAHSCEHCGKQFKEAGALVQHIAGIHRGERFPCDECSYLATRAGNLARHKKRFHTGERNSPCPFCPAMFVTSTVMKSHCRKKHPTELQQKHEEENPYPCRVCGKRFPTQIEVSRHRKYLHSNKTA